MKKILIGILSVTIMMLYSCTGEANNGLASDSEKENITTSSYLENVETTSVSSIELTDVVPDDSTEDGSVIPDQSFIGVWSTDELKTNQILIYEITGASLRINTGVSGLFGIDVTAMLLNGEFVFGDGISPGYSGPEGIKGRVKFYKNSIIVTYDSFGFLEDSEYYSDSYTFTLKDENSEEIISQYKATLPD